MKFDNDIIAHKKMGNIEYLQFKELLKYSNILHLYPLKHGGNSKGKYSSLNLGMFTNDNVEIVKQNYLDVCKLFNIDYRKVFIPKQIHSDMIVNIDNTFNNVIKYIECDGIVTEKNNITIVTNSADCMNIVLFDKKKNVIGNIHAGWKGVLNNICVNAIKNMVNKYHCDVSDIIVCIWPSICKKCFEVKYDVVDLFRNMFIIANEYIEKIHNNKYLIDLKEIQKRNLKEIGIKNSNIYIADICTKCNPNDFYSYRENNVTGRHASFITLREGLN